jgi:hypothetical protein
MVYNKVNGFDLQKAQEIASKRASKKENKEKRLNYNEIKILVVFFLTKRKTLSFEQIYRVMKKYDSSLALGKLEQAIYELLIEEVIEEKSADEFILI